MNNKSGSVHHSDRPPVYLSPDERERYTELAKNYRSVAGMRVGSEAVTAYEKSAQFYELIRDHSTANEMRQFANWIRGGGANEAIAYERNAKRHETSGRHALAQKLRNSAELTRQITRRTQPNNSIAASIISIAFLGGLSFLYSGISGKAIVDIDSSTSNMAGIVLILIAIAFGVFYILRSKRNRK